MRIDAGESSTSAAGTVSAVTVSEHVGDAGAPGLAVRRAIPLAAARSSEAAGNPCGCSDGGGPCVEEFLDRSGARQLPHAHGRTLRDHLVGTRGILKRWLQPRWIQNAGAVHSVYSTAVYRRQLLPLSRRDEVRAVVGERAERLAYLFCVLDRDDLLRVCGQPVVREAWVRRFDDRGAGETIDQHDASQLLLLLMANLAEQARGQDGGPGRWMARVSGLGAMLDDQRVIVPPAFGSLTCAVSPTEEDRVREFYLAGLRAGDEAEARQHFTRAVNECRWVAEPLVALAYGAARRGRLSEARRWIEHARRAATELGVAWDPRLSHPQWLKLISWLREQASGRGQGREALPRSIRGTVRG